MRKLLESMRDSVRKSIERDKKLEKPIEKVSRLIWPWQESKLVLFVSLLAIMDYVSTFAALKLSRNNQVYESGLLAKWALATGGFPKLFFVDAAAIGALILIAIGVSSIYSRLGHPGYRRTAFIFLLLPYAVFIIVVVINNIVNIFR
jgi:uncharacterized membrane protein (DUF485 family)